jgi:hypothetical protein
LALQESKEEQVAAVVDDGVRYGTVGSAEVGHQPTALSLHLHQPQPENKGGGLSKYQGQNDARSNDSLAAKGGGGEVPFEGKSNRDKKEK